MVNAQNNEGLLTKFTVLRGALRELWIIFGTKILSIVAYGLVNMTLILWLSKDVGFTDIGAGTVVAIWSTALTLVTVMVGSLVDAIGIKKALIIGFGVCIFSRGIMSFITSPWLVIPGGLIPLAVGEALMVPVMVAAIKKYATTAQRSMAFSLFYAMMNVGFAIAGYIFDRVRSDMGEYTGLTMPGTDWHLTTYQFLIFVGFLFTIPNLILVLVGIRDRISMGEDGKIVEEEPKPNAYSDLPAGKAMLASCHDTFLEWKRIFSSLWHQPAFYRFLIFLTIVVGVRLVFYHFHYTFPKYGIRCLGEGAPIGQLWGVLNPVLIVILVPIIGALTQKISAYKTVIIGSTITALGVLIMALPPTLFTVLANGWLGNLIANTWLGVNSAVVNPLYVSIFIAVIFISIGEAFYSPRLYEYPAAIAPKGQEASYMSLSMLPYFIAKFFVGILSGFLLKEFCPEVGARNPEMIWLIVGLMALATPIGLLIFKKHVQVHESGRDDE